MTDLKLFKRTEKRLVGSLQPTTDAETSARMGRIRQRGTAPELLVRQACRRLGMRYQTSNEDLPGSPDLANRSRRWAIFVHGCFWHRHPGCSKATIPKRNTAFWAAKFERNAERDRVARARLRRISFQVLTLWQCEVESPDVLGRRLRKFVHSSEWALQSVVEKRLRDVHTVLRIHDEETTR